MFLLNRRIRIQAQKEALTGNTILTRFKKSKSLLEQSLSQIQNMVPVMLASKMSLIITELRRVKLGLDPYEEEAGKAVRSLLKGYRTRNSSENETGNDLIRIAALRLQITSQRALVIERTVTCTTGMVFDMIRRLCMLLFLGFPWPISV
ncbi:hypothetical protein L1887_11694 [Cichorium endivia]|nr:hypothetical protein L1887_11694 [Cichorium endivia]